MASPLKEGFVSAYIVHALRTRFCAVGNGRVGMPRLRCLCRTACHVTHAQVPTVSCYNNTRELARGMTWPAGAVPHRKRAEMVVEVESRGAPGGACREGRA